MTQASDQGIHNGETPAVSMQKRRNFAATYIPPTFTDEIVRAGVPVYVCGPIPDVAELERLAGAGWVVHADGRYPVLRDASTGSTVRWAASWFGDGVTLDEAEQLWPRLERFVRRAFGPTARPIGSPATTGRDTWLRTIPPGVQYPTLPHELQTLIRSTAGQGRIELFAPRAATVPAVIEYDQRLAYGALLRGLPAGDPAVFDAVTAPGVFFSNPYAPARWFVTWQAPDGWEHPGILPATRTIESGPTWPLSATAPAWVDGAELHLAHRFGWHLQIHEGIVWPRTADPFRTWANRLIESSGEAGPRWRSAMRGLLLHTIGAMFGADRTVTVFGDTPPADAESLQLLASGAARWIEREPAVWPETHHPEWSAAVWARARVRLLDAPLPGQRGHRCGALHVPAGTLIGFRTDAIYMTTDPGWSDDGAAGRFVFKRAGVAGPWPVTHTALLEARDAR